MLVVDEDFISHFLIWLSLVVLSKLMNPPMVLHVVAVHLQLYQGQFFLSSTHMD
jgi:hypothetical protein